jgi:hypothetical protein
MKKVRMTGKSTMLEVSCSLTSVGPARGQPMQLVLPSEPDEENIQGPLTMIDNGRGKGKSKASTRQRQLLTCLTNHVCLLII